MQLFYLTTVLIIFLSIVFTVNSEEKEINNARGIRRFLIFPGTKWCGPGNTAEHDYDLGSNSQVDTCCRNHDRCQPKVRAGEMKYGVVNNESTSLLSCTCDVVFLNCLEAVNSWTSRIIRSIYFSLLHRECFHFVVENNNRTPSRLNILESSNNTDFGFFSWF